MYVLSDNFTDDLLQRIPEQKRPEMLFLNPVPFVISLAPTKRITFYYEIRDNSEKLNKNMMRYG